MMFNIRNGSKLTLVLHTLSSVYLGKKEEFSKLKKPRKMDSLTLKSI